MHATIADVIADTAQNSIEAGASFISVTVVEDGKYVSVEISDNGKGMDGETLGRAFDPFYSEAGKHDMRKVGLGLPILKQMCEACDGRVELKSSKGAGTDLKYCFSASHIDLPPMGNLAETVTALFNYPGNFDLKFSHRTRGGSYSVKRSEIEEAVGNLETVEGMSLAKEFLLSQEESLG